MPYFYQISLILLAIVVSFYGHYLIKAETHCINPLDLITDGHTKRLDYKKVALNTAALLQCFTWLRMSLGFPVHRALEDPWMWIVFYAVIAGHDLLGRVVKIKTETALGSH